MDPAKCSEALALLQKTGSTEGGSLYDHLTKLVVKVLEEKPANPVDVLETALLIKKAGSASGATAVAPPATIADTAQAVARAKLYGASDVPIDPETGEPVDVDSPNEYECEDILADAVLFDALGVGLGRAEMSDVAMAVKKLGEDPRKAVATVRFFGKFFGTHADYYIFETTLKTPPEEPEQQPQGEGEVPTEWNTGANGYVYWACNYLGGPLTQLPAVTPAQVKAARGLKRLLTGRLSSSVSSYPVFPGTEANFLRAQITRISCTTVVCPAGLFVVNEDGGLENAEEFSPLPAREMGAAANWSHRYPHLKQQGRCALHQREAPEGEEDSFELTEEEQEEGPEQLAALEGDAEVQGGPAWSPLFSSSNEHTKNQVAGLRSNLWPGAACACQVSRFTNVYVGWGVKNAAFVPLPPPPVSREYDAALVESAELPTKLAPGGEEQEGEA